MKKKRGPAKPQGMNLAQAKAREKLVFDELVKAEAWKLFLRWSDHLQQEVIDAAFMAANDLFGMGQGRCEAFGGRIILYRDEIAKLIMANTYTVDFPVHLGQTVWVDSSTLPLDELAPDVLVKPYFKAEVRGLKIQRKGDTDRKSIQYVGGGA